MLALVAVIVASKLALPTSNPPPLVDEPVARELPRWLLRKLPSAAHPSMYRVVVMFATPLTAVKSPRTQVPAEIAVVTAAVPE